MYMIRRNIERILPHWLKRAIEIFVLSCIPQYWRWRRRHSRKLLKFKDEYRGKVMGYQERDWEVVDHKSYLLDIDNNQKVRLKGPKPKNLEKGKYISCIGAAQTFGAWCEKPYPLLLQKKLGIVVFNLGIGGAGPYQFLYSKRLMEYINDSNIAIIQVMSGRSVPNSLFSKGGGVVIRRLDNKKIACDLAYQELIDNNDLSFVKKIIKETRENYIVGYKELLKKIEVPKILFWFSKRKPHYVDNYASQHVLFNDFPQLVNLQMVEEIKKYCDEYVECVSKRGMPQKLISRFTGKPYFADFSKCSKYFAYQKPRNFNNYYPSPEMHEDAADLLELYLT
jgi:hypothetical protein